MNKYEFLGRLRERLAGLPPKDIDASLDYYAELIADRIEDGMSEEEAVAAMGSIDEIVAQILEDTSLPKLVKEKVRPKRALRTWEILLIVLGFPLWFILLVTFASIIFSVLVAIGSVIISVFAVAIAVGACALAFIVAGLICFVTAKGALGTILIGASLICAGLCILFFIGATYASKGILWLCKKGIYAIKSCFVGKEAKV
ncbi:MAG: DUF1700 domain-containing protein [Clostridia bacterium]|nr:DUF1700 domain-containing protein [Clostridia bacterium]